MNRVKINYMGEKVSIGIDVHKVHYTVSCVMDGELVQRATMPAEPERLVLFIKQRFEGAKISSCYEAGFSGFVLHRALEKAGIDNIVVNAGSIEVASRDRVKTDRRDSLKIAQQLECGRLKGIRVPTIEEEAQRLLQRTREQLVRKRTCIMNQIRMRLYQFGISLPGAISSRKVEKFLSEAQLIAELEISIRALLRLWNEINVEMSSLQEQMKKQSEGDTQDAIYRSIPGYGFQTVRVVSTELGDMKQFSNERKLFSFLGLTPSERSSGETQRKGHTSRQGSARLRCVLVEAAWSAVRYDEHWGAVYRRLAARIGGRRAIVAVARRLIGLARALIREQKLYQQPELQVAA
jgi:transposase